VIRYAAQLDAPASGDLLAPEKIALSAEGETVFSATLQGQTVTVKLVKLGPHPLQWLIAMPQADGSMTWQSAFARPDPNTAGLWQIWLAGNTYLIQVTNSLAKPKTTSKADKATVLPVIESPMPGRILKVLLKEGDAVEANQPAVVMTSMKMELTLVTPLAGVVSAVLCDPEQLVDAHAVLITLKPSDLTPSELTSS
jgi:acetyl/propionyl-CoA carboxylase alpha subunit